MNAVFSIYKFLKTALTAGAKHFRLFLLLSVICLSVLSCSKDSSTPVDPGKSIGDAAAIIPIVYYHVTDSDGEKPQANTDIVLLFEPNGISHIYIGQEDYAQAYKGTYSVSASNVKLKYADSDLNFDVAFAVDTSKETISAPFKLFSAGAGSSTWRKVRMPVEGLLITIFNASVLAEGITSDAAVTRAMDYINVYKTIANKSNGGGGIQSLGSSIESATKMTNCIELKYADESFSTVELFNVFTKEEVSGLTIGGLAGDPRVHLNVISPNLPLYDPIEKTALLYAPFDTSFFPGWKASSGGRIVWDPSNSLKTFGKFDKLTEQSKDLEDYGYKCKIVADGKTTPLELIKQLLPGDGRTTSPGYIYLSTHGFENGDVCISTLYFTIADRQRIVDALTNKYPEVLTYDDGKPILGSLSSNRGWRPGVLHYMLLARPKFWKWIREKGANFSNSFFLVGACLTDKNPELRAMIQAKAYFSFSNLVQSEFCGAVSRYFVKSLIRPTHSAEEAYYNILRVSATKQMIYTEDNILQNVIPAGDGPVVDWFKGYGWDGKEAIPYQTNGWYSTGFGDVGAIWWMLFAGRWGQNAEGGLQGLWDCWNTLWSKGQMGGLANPGCNAKTPGRLPTQDEVAYVGYLLAGDLTFPYTTTANHVPRFTLFDGK